MAEPLLSMKIDGLEALIAKCKAPIHAAPIKAAFTESALDLEAQAKSNVPRVTGALQRSILHRIDGAAMPTFADVGLLGGGPSSKTGGKYGPWVHDGTKPHEIRPKNKKVLAWKGASVKKGQRGKNKYKGWIIAHVVQHPGTKPNRFLTWSLMEMRGKIELNFADAARLIEAAWGK